MKKMFLASEFGYSGDLLKEKSQYLADKPKVAYISNAADLDSDREWMNHNRDMFLKLGFEIINIDLRILKFEKLNEALLSTDAVYMEGGNTFYLLDICNKSGFTYIIKDLIINKDKLYIGTSAGSVIAGPNIEFSKFLDDPSAAPELADFTGLGLVNFEVIPHIGNDDFFKLNENCYNDLFKNLKNYKYPHICLRDNQAVWVENDKFEILNYEF
ncbi:hypothetical protein A3F07_04330 [candidate division WWE3 bacterium RIFCSPHIGHO2_12_FULL_38_15]|uniref:Peptidase S51 n=1 Tax=candidate division WWE3 bacterium RIFCSPHIGHO2_02_FULL_38_14 TaxID=1802620 RepID=A0A1F4V841_UNCKA|nr:MAG: hypothetical protein A3F07_04330 [candidate division WWE3 bacterium RIFCSPHIGHO2_12_FULL_38_15]OGC52914.1 MAG: hypothetical protein A3B64_02805 [candidate division WWE3 bacterium RIFCSPLOWO2_01_FULL_37_24]OGC53317.1 MAG: hypothetical protein A3D91_02820 [candidate division WWE3 bacterium RIFCSPHIGHO2_02_FULL_38_14]HLB51830.1 Type 1 glutamine amidotransferase-like domain-containing protein [Patescibacteria group bacterium]